MGDRHKQLSPISLTCITSKIMEHIIVSNLMKRLEIQNILFPHYHGFRQYHSCESQLPLPEPKLQPVAGMG